MHCTVLILHFTLLVLHYITLSSGPHYTALHCTDTVLSNPHCVSPVTCHLSFVTDVCHTTHITVHSINTQYTSLLASTLSCLTLPCLVTLHCAIQVLYCTALLASTLHYFTTLQQYNTVYSLYSVQSVLLSSLHSTARSYKASSLVSSELWSVEIFTPLSLLSLCVTTVAVTTLTMCHYRHYC